MARSTRSNRSIAARLIASIRDVLAELFSAYRPERHYMRGGRTGGAALRT
jgi:hypothetical protein